MSKDRAELDIKAKLNEIVESKKVSHGAIGFGTITIVHIKNCFNFFFLRPCSNASTRIFNQNTKVGNEFLAID